jgi:hypothetical protein
MIDTHSNTMYFDVKNYRLKPVDSYATESLGAAEAASRIRG